MKTEKIHVAHWGTHVVAEGKKVNVSVVVDNMTGTEEKIVVRNKVVDAEGKTVAEAAKTVTLPSASPMLLVYPPKPADKSRSTYHTTLTVKRPQLWSCESPYVYTVKTEIIVGGNIVDTYETTTGFRTFKFDAAKGFSLNG